jgi:hypothetical protein
VQSGLAIKVLALKSEVLFFDEMRFAVLLEGVASHLVACLPDRLAVGVGELFGQAVEVVVVVADVLKVAAAIDAVVASAWRQGRGS